MARRDIIGLGAVAALAAAAGTWAWSAAVRRRWDGIEAAVLAGDEPRPRTDLPPEVAALAARYGVDGSRLGRGARFEETGAMWFAPGGKPVFFRARQAASAARPDFLWRAEAGPGGAVAVADYAVGGEAGLEARLLGGVPLAKAMGAAFLRGERMRYLAELPWNPDAILGNPALDWTVIDRATLKVATGTGEARAEVVLNLDDEGLVAAAGAPARDRLENGRLVPRPWRGRFSDPWRFGDRLVPTAGEVAWTLDGTEFVYWRGRIAHWAAA